MYTRKVQFLSATKDTASLTGPENQISSLLVILKHVYVFREKRKVTKKKNQDYSA
jgi:hypothetical protein